MYENFVIALYIFEKFFPDLINPYIFMNFQKPLPPAPMLPSRGQTTESGFVPVTPSWLSYSATHAPKVLQNPRFYRQNDATATQHSGLLPNFVFVFLFSYKCKRRLQKFSSLSTFNFQKLSFLLPFRIHKIKHHYSHLFNKRGAHAY